MEDENKPYIVYVDTSYLTYMSASEKGDWLRLLEHAKSCTGDLNIKPRVEIHISEIALREYRGKMVDDLVAAISKVKNQVIPLERKWNGSMISRGLTYPFPKERDIFPSNENIKEEADKYIASLMKSGVTLVHIKEHHKDAVWDSYYNWASPFDQDPSDRDNEKVREKRRLHIPDAWILQAAIDAQKQDHKMLCLCKDDHLSNALTKAQHHIYKSANEVWDILFSPPPPLPSLDDNSMVPQDIGIESTTSLDTILSSAVNKNIRNIYLRLLGFVVALKIPTHESLVNAVVARGYNKRLTEACAIILSDESMPYIKNTGSHYIVGDKAICNEASGRLTHEIIEMLNEDENGN